MAGRIRSIKPELLEDEKACALSDSAWRLFVSSWLLCDDHGRFRAGARYLAAQVWQDTRRVKCAEDSLAELVNAGRVRVYQVGGDTYGEIPTWTRHQRIDNAGRERIPRPQEGAFNDSDSLRAISPKPSKSREEKSEPPLGPTPPAALPPTSDLDLRATEQRNNGRSPQPPKGGSGSGAEVGPAGGAEPLVLTPLAPPALRTKRPRSAPKDPDRAEVRYCAAFCAGITDGSGGAGFTPPMPSAFGAPFGRALAAHAPGVVGDDLLAWIRATAAEWRRAADGRFVNGWAPRRFLEWLNAGRPKATNGARGPGVANVQPAAKDGEFKWEMPVEQ